MKDKAGDGEFFYIAPQPVINYGKQPCYKQQPPKGALKIAQQADDSRHKPVIDLARTEKIRAHQIHQNESVFRTPSAYGQ